MSAFLSDDDLVAAVRVAEVNEDSDSEAEDYLHESPSITALSVSQKLTEIRNFMKSHDAPQNILDNLAELELFATSSNIQYFHTKITDYFN